MGENEGRAERVIFFIFFNGETTSGELRGEPFGDITLLESVALKHGITVGLSDKGGSTIEGRIGLDVGTEGRSFDS